MVSLYLLGKVGVGKVSRDSRLSIVGGLSLLTVVEVQLLPRDTHWPEHHWQPLVLAVQL